VKKIGTVLILCALAALVGLNWTWPSQAAVTTNVIHVTTTTDAIFPDDACSLREAIDNVNTYSRQEFAVPGDNECPAGSTTEPNVIVLQSGAIYTLSNPGNDELTGDLDILENMRIEVVGGSDSAAIVIAVAGERVMEIHSGAVVELDNISLGGANGAALSGGGIFNSGHLTATNVLISDNVAAAGGGLYNNSGATAVFIDSEIVLNQALDLLAGGGILNFGALTLDNSDVRANTVGGGIHNNGGQLTVRNESAVNANTGANGGGIYNSAGGTVIVTDSSVDGNTAAAAGGGIYSIAGGTVTVANSSVNGNAANDGAGGGIYSAADGMVMVTNSTVSDNTATDSGGGVFTGSDLTMSDSVVEGNISLDNGGGIAGNVSDAPVIRINNSEIKENTASNYGGGMAYYKTVGDQEDSLYIENSLFLQNQAINGSGGGLSGSGYITHTQFISNTAGNAGGGLHAIITRFDTLEARGNNSTGSGGGIRSLGIYGQNLTVVDNQTATGAGGGVSAYRAVLQDALIDGNSAGGDGGGLSLTNSLPNPSILSRVAVTNNSAGGVGGGIRVANDLVMGNVTVSSNGATGFGAGLYIAATGAVTATNVTLAVNMPGVNLYKLGDLTLQNSVIGTPDQPSCTMGLDNPFINSLGNNVADDTTCILTPHVSDIVNEPLMLDPLMDNGGNTLTHALQEGSPAVGHGNPAACAADPVNGVDQRGVPRPADSCDSGAYQTALPTLYLPIIIRP
jgi:CSLREA domain-containing protein